MTSKDKACTCLLPLGIDVEQEPTIIVKICKEYIYSVFSAVNQQSICKDHSWFNTIKFQIHNLLLHVIELYDLHTA